MNGITSRGERIARWVRWLLLLASAVIAVTAWVRWFPRSHGAEEARLDRYYCPMHPQIRSPEAGECPVCGMKLEPIPKDKLREDLTVVPTMGSVEPSLGGLAVAPVQLELDRVQAMGVRTITVTHRDYEPRLRASATLELPERARTEVHSRVSGFVEAQAVSEIGTHVQTGQYLLSLYAPDVYQAERELLAARSLGSLGASTLQASRERLGLLGVSPREIDSVLRAGAPSRLTGISALHGGVVVRRGAVLGGYVTPETTLYEVADLSTLFVMGEAPAASQGELRRGLRGVFAAGDMELPIQVDLLLPSLDTNARVVRFRATVANHDEALRPGQPGVITLTLSRRAALWLPRDAIVDTGEVRYAFVDQGAGRFEARALQVTDDGGEWIAVDQGLHEGEHVVEHATFLLDAESRLRGALLDPGGAPPLALGAPAAPPSSTALLAVPPLAPRPMSFGSSESRGSP